MDALETKRLYLILMTEPETERRQMALETLSKADDGARLMSIASAVSDAINGRMEPSLLSDVIDEFSLFPIDTYWNGFAEMTGQVLVSAAIQMPKGEKRSELIRQGLKAMWMAQNGGLLLSAVAVDLVKRVKKDNPDLAKKIFLRNRMERMETSKKS